MFACVSRQSMRAGAFLIHIYEARLQKKMVAAGMEEESAYDYGMVFMEWCTRRST